MFESKTAIIFWLALALFTLMFQSILWGIFMAVVIVLVVDYYSKK